MKKKEYHILGVMSGTSLDGIDLAEIKFEISSDSQWSFSIISSETVPYTSAWQEKLKQAVSFSNTELDALDLKYTVFLSEVIKTYIGKNSIENLDAVCSHGHTILHQPENGITLQIGNVPELAVLTNQKVVCDFRVQDVEHGGQGAPLVPIGDKLLFNEYNYCLNLGGFANCSYEKEGTRIAYDICPVNIILNKYARALGHSFDDRGAIASNGLLDASLLNTLNTIQYYNDMPPKSLGLEWVDAFIMPILEVAGNSIEDIMRTLTEHFAFQIGRQFKEGTTILVTGGGAYNDYLISRIRNYCSSTLVIPSEEIIEYKEALIFGLLGVLKLRNEINCLSSVTGATHNHSSGVILYP